MKDPECKAVVMAFDSPGGSVFGLTELCARIRSARDQKRIVGLVDSLAASAAYWMCSQCSEVVITPGGQCGSIGCYTCHMDQSKAEEMEGVKTTMVSAGKYKVEGNPYGPLDEDARAELQSKVDHYYGLFTSDVAKGRGLDASVVRGPRFGQGRMLTAQQAVDGGAADRIGTLADVLKRLGVDSGKKTSAAAAAARVRALEVSE
jgi:signal peptide peptidase SppA